MVRLIYIYVLFAHMFILYILCSGVIRQILSIDNQLSIKLMPIFFFLFSLPLVRRNQFFNRKYYLFTSLTLMIVPVHHSAFFVENLFCQYIITGLPTILYFREGQIISAPVV